MKRVLSIAASITAICALWSAPAHALKYAAPEHNLKVDPATPAWHPAPVPVPEGAKEVELNIVGSDTMDELVIGWAKLYRKQYPVISVTEDLRASGAGSPGLVSGKGFLLVGA